MSGKFQKRTFRTCNCGAVNLMSRKFTYLMLISVGWSACLYFGARNSSTMSNDTQNVDQTRDIFASDTCDDFIRDKHRVSTRSVFETAGVLFPFRLNPAFIPDADEARAMRDSVNLMLPPVSNTSSETSVKLNITKEEVSQINTEKWKRFSNVTNYPIPSFDGRYVLNSKHVCSNGTSPVFMFLIFTEAKNINRRQAIRESWANNRYFQKHTFNAVFILGKSAKDDAQRKLYQENVIYGDLVQGTFNDSSSCTPHKTVLGMRWVIEHCKQALYIVQVNDYYFVNTFKLIELSETTFINKARHIWCKVIDTGKSVIDRNSVWKVDANEFRNLTTYPVTYCDGSFAVVTNDLVTEMFEASKLVPLFGIEAVYRGLLADVIGSVQHTNLTNIHETIAYSNTDKYCFDHPTCNLTAKNGVNLWDLLYMWKISTVHYSGLAGEQYKSGALG